ncbi:hypothetical protein MRX96_038774 [Rhipicephalus microplus]
MKAGTFIFMSLEAELLRNVLKKNDFAFIPFFSVVAVYAVFATVCLWTLTYEVPVFFMDVPGSVEYVDLSLMQKIQSSIFPNMAAHWIFRIISLHEENNDGTHWSNFRVPGSPYDNVTLFGMTLVVCCYCVIYGMFVWYLDNVWPWQYGIPKDPLNRCVTTRAQLEPEDALGSHTRVVFGFAQRSYWFYSRRKQVTISESTTDSAEPDATIEGVGDRTNPGIVLNDVTKTVAVWHVSLKAYQGDVTVLLGRNGAGKTTRLRLITGLEQETEGCVYVAGFDVALETDSARRSMGFCPQENLLFRGLTVLEHLQFFARIRSDSWATGYEAIEEILEAFNLAEKRDALASSLSWGTMRKLQLGVAIVGSPLIVVLDEPTAGADPECKGALWECVLRFHEDKTMLLITHSMKEADTQGDRIAVLASGWLRCCGSPLFLRTTYGTGYWIRAGMKNFSPARPFADLVRRCVPRAHIKADDHQTLNANVGDPGVKTLIQLLRELEENRHTYLLDSVSVFVAALEDVLRCLDRDPGGSEEEGMPDCPCALVDANKVAAGGINPSGQQRLYALVVKRLQYGRRDIRPPMLMLLLPLSVTCASARPCVRAWAFLSDGRFACLGSTQQLKESIGHGATVLARSASPDPHPLLEAMESRFPGCHLRWRQAKALLRFHVPARPWHERFIGMEKELRAEELIHEYLVSNVSLTEVFRHFTKHKRTPAPTPASTPAISPAFTPAHAPTSSQCPRVIHWRQLRLLLWKTVYLYRLRRNWAITALEVLTPLLLTVVQNYVRCNGYNVGDTPLPIPTIGTTFAGSDSDAPSVIRADKACLFCPFFLNVYATTVVTLIS